MKLSKEELKKKISEVVADEDTQIALLEDIEDSFVESEDGDKVEKTAYDEVVAERDEIKRKYKERFLKGDNVEDEDSKEDDEELKEEEVIDVKEI